MLLPEDAGVWEQELESAEKELLFNEALSGMVYHFNFYYTVVDIYGRYIWQIDGLVVNIVR